ncbi:MAG TPA: OsmC family protein [Cyclobacteriaceae bacterium]|nr:OsmC family protein [Cyclobacteriaceae bacterium]
MVKIEIKRLNDAYHMEATNEQGATLQMDASPDMGGLNKGMRPMQVVLTALGGCSVIDVISILKKQKQDLKDIQLTVTGERENVAPSPYTEANIHFRLYGNVDEDKVQKAVSLSVEKYCSVAESLKPQTKITYSFEIIPA